MVEPAFSEGSTNKDGSNRHVMLVQNAGVGSTVRLCWFKMVELVQPAFENC